MKEIKIDMGSIPPIHLLNWPKSNNIIKGDPWKKVIEIFNKTTNGQMVGERDARHYKLVFENEQDYIMYMLKYS